MDIFAHGLWAAAAAKGLNLKISKVGGQPGLSVGQAAFWGVFPDLFAFTIPFLGLVWNLNFAGLDLADFPRPDDMEPPSQETVWLFNLASHLYNISHSLAVFLLIFTAIMLIFRRPVWELLAWLLHIIIDIPTHSYQFYPTPFLWPISEWKYDGISWAAPWFMAANYSALSIIWIYFWFRRRRVAKKQLM